MISLYLLINNNIINIFSIINYSFTNYYFVCMKFMFDGIFCDFNKKIYTSIKSLIDKKNCNTFKLSDKIDDLDEFDDVYNIYEFDDFDDLDLD